MLVIMRFTIFARSYHSAFFGGAQLYDFRILSQRQQSHQKKGVRHKPTHRQVLKYQGNGLGSLSKEPQEYGRHNIRIYLPRSTYLDPQSM